MICYEYTSFFRFQNRKLCTIILAFCWCAGLLLGCYFANDAGVLLTSLMHKAIRCPVSIVGLIVVLLPFLLSATAVIFSRTWLFLPLCFCKAFQFAYLAGMVNITFGYAGWLIRLLLLFTDCLMIPLLLWFWLRWLGRQSKPAITELAVVAGTCTMIWMIDYFVVSPFLGMLI